MPDFAIERRCEGVVCGIDEAGRGPLAGPVVAAAVIIDRRRFRGELRYVLDDLKVLSRELRESCYDGLHAGLRSGIVIIGVGAASVAEIDRINVLRANLLAMAAGGDGDCSTHRISCRMWRWSTATSRHPCPARCALLSKAIR